MVLCTPGSAGTMIRAGIAVVGRQVGAVDPKGEQRIRVRHLIGLQGGAIERPKRSSDRTNADLGVGHAGQRGQVAQRHAGPRLGGRPTLDAGDRKSGGVLRHRGQHRAVEDSPVSGRRSV